MISSSTFCPVLRTPHLPWPEPDGDAHVLSLVQEAAGVADLEVQIMVVGLGPELQLLHVVRVLLLAGFLRRLLLLVLVLAEVHDPDDGRAGAGRDLDEVQPHVGSLLSGLFQGNDPDLLPLCVDQPYRADADVFVYASSCSGDDFLLSKVFACGVSAAPLLVPGGSAIEPAHRRCEGDPAATV